VTGTVGGAGYDPAVVAFAAVAFAVIGLAFGSFVTVLVHRLPEGRSIVAPRSACPTCGAEVTPRDNVPVVSYLLLGGHCRSCRSPISAEYPVIEAAVGGLFVAAALLVHPVWVAALIAPFLGVLLAAGVIDAKYRIIPNRLTYTSIVVAAVAIAIIAVTAGDVSVRDALIGLVAYSGFLLLVAVVSTAIVGRDGMGMGDVKLAALIGLVLGALGLQFVAAAALLGVTLGGIAAIVALARGRGRKATMPFGPFLAAGAATAALFGRPLIDWYTGLAH
jgi:leader peptidase (prepilin peptidase) / N-methyltransferase